MKKMLGALGALLLFLCAGATGAAGAQQFITMNVAGAGNAAQSAQSAVRLTELSVDVEIMGSLAVTTLDMVFANGTDRVLEGGLEFPLGEGESVTGYALDINGTMRQGVVVEKERARQVFEAVVRQGIDPGLVEQTAGNNFRTRVYPLPAHGSRRVQLTYQGTLGRGTGACVYSFNALPQGTLDSFSFKITVLDTAAKAELVPSGSPDAPIFSIDVEDMKSGYTAQFSKKNVTLRAPISVRIPERAAQDSGAVFTQTVGTDTFFYYTVPVRAEGRAKPLPKSLTVWWDCSASAKNRDITTELDFLTQYLATLGNTTVTVVPFCNELHEAKQFSGSAERIAESLVQYVSQIGYDGATNLNYDFAAFGGDEVLVFTDGLANWDTAYAEKMAAQGAGASPAGGAAAPRANTPRVYTVNSAVSADHAWLSALAQQNGGTYINLAEASRHRLADTARFDADKTADVSAALSLMLGEPYRLIRAEYDKGAVRDVFPGNGAAAGADFALTGVLMRKSVDITLCFGYGNKVSERVTVHVSAAEGIESAHVAREWAAQNIAALSADYARNKAEIIALAKKFGVVTEGTSLLVLDSAADYVRYGIVPPKADAALYAEYEKITARQGAAAKPSGSVQGAIPASVYAAFKEFKAWWNTPRSEFKKKKSPKTGGSPVPVPLPVRPVVPLEVDADVMMGVDEAASAQMQEYAEAAPLVATESRTMGRPALSRAVVAEDASPMAAGAPAVPEAPAGGAKIQLQAWSPDADYLRVLKRAPTAQMYAQYLALKADYGASPAFYMEASDYFAAEGLLPESIRILSNLAELNLENSDVLRALANKLTERGLYALAVPVFEKLVALRAEIPQFYRDLGLAYWYAGDVQKAVDTLYSVAKKPWDARFEQVQQVALNDMNALLADCARRGISVDTTAFDPALLQNFDVDVRIVLTWNTDDCDIDLWVTDVDGEKCYYGNRLTANGGRMSRDFTQGYGPEEFCIRTAPSGSLKIEANYFGNHQQKLLQPVTVQAEVYTNFGRANQTRQVLTLQLADVKGTFHIGNVMF